MKRKKVTAFIPIKLNSQRLPFKNKLLLGNHPLAYYICETLLKIDRIDDIYVYCSDNQVIDYIPNKVKFLKRSKQLDGDLVKGEEIYRSFIEEVDSDIYILAHTTSPFLKHSSIENALNNVLEKEYDSALSVQKVQTFSWYKGLPINYSLTDIPRTQDIEPIFVETSGFFIFEKSVFTEYGRRVGFKPYLQLVNHVEAIDIDTKEDYEFALKFI